MCAYAFQPEISQRNHSKNRWFQFTLGRLLLGVTLAAIGFGWYSERRNREARAVFEIRALGGEVEFGTRLQPRVGEWEFGYGKHRTPAAAKRVLEVRLQAPSERPLDLRPLASLPSLESIVFINQRLSDDAFAALAGLKKLERLTIDSTPLTARHFAALSEHDELCDLQATEVNASEETLRDFPRLPSLLTLRLKDRGITDDALSALSRATGLAELHLNSTNVTGRGLASLATLPIQTLDLAGSPINDDGLRGLLEWKHLRTLILTGTDVSDSGLSSLERLPSLTMLILSGTQVGDQSVESLLNFPKLRWLEVSGCRISQAGIKRLAQRYPHVAHSSHDATLSESEATELLNSLPEFNSESRSSRE